MSQSKPATKQASDTRTTTVPAPEDAVTLDLPRLLTDDGRAMTLHMDGAPTLIVLNPGSHPNSGPAWLH